MIPGISDVRRLPRLGKIRLGMKRTSDAGKAYPAALDHFNFKDAPGVEAIYGANCSEIDIVIPVEDSNVFFPQALKAYRSSGLFCRCDDGQTATRVRVGPDEKGQPRDAQGEAWLAKTGEAVDVGDMFEMPCPHHECPFFERKF